MALGSVGWRGWGCGGEVKQAATEPRQGFDGNSEHSRKPLKAAGLLSGICSDGRSVALVI